MFSLLMVFLIQAKFPFNWNVILFYTENIFIYVLLIVLKFHMQFFFYIMNAKCLFLRAANRREYEFIFSSLVCKLNELRGDSQIFKDTHSHALTFQNKYSFIGINELNVSS